MEKGKDKMDNRKNIKIFTFILALLTVLFTLGLTKTSAETPGVTVSGKFVDTIKNIQVSREKVAVLIALSVNGNSLESLRILI